MAIVATAATIGLAQGGTQAIQVLPRFVPTRSYVEFASSSPGSVGSASVRISLPQEQRPLAMARASYMPSAPPTAVIPGDRHAVVIGINHAPGAPTLQGAVTDAMNVKRALIMYGFPAQNVRTLIEGQATRGAILGALDQLAASAPTNGLAVLAIAAHTRVRGGEEQMLAADGQRINSSEIASRMQRVRSPALTLLPTCYAGGYAIPGIVGPRRIAAFASSSNSPSYELGDKGSYLIINMVQKAMIEGQAPYSVEGSFDYARRTLERTNPNRVPLISDGFEGELVLGPVKWVRPPASAEAAPSRQESPDAQPQAEAGTPPSDGSNSGEEEGSGNSSWMAVCAGRYHYNCDD